jgi:hypothetical protein
MKKKSTSQSAFFNLRVLTAAVFCLFAIAVALFAQGKGPKQTQQTNRSTTSQDVPGTQRPEVMRMVGPVVLNADLRDLPYIAPKREVEERRLTRYPFPENGAPPPLPAGYQQFQALLKKIWRPTPTMPGPLRTFDGITAAQSGCSCFPPDSDGDVGPNHYINAVNSSFRVFDKSGNPLSPVTTFNSLFAPLGNSTPCGNNQNDGDPFAFYDQIADRWVISDFAFPGAPGPGPFYQCIAVSQTSDPVSGGWFLYAVQHEPTQPTWIGDYPKMALWNNPQPGGAYHLTVNLFDGPTLSFRGVRVFALDRGSMLTGGPANVIAFTLTAADVGASYSFVAATFRAGDPPPAGRDEFVLAIDRPRSMRRYWDFAVSIRQERLSSLPSAVAMVSRSCSAKSWNPILSCQTKSRGNVGCLLLGKRRSGSARRTPCKSRRYSVRTSYSGGISNEGICRSRL